jgi:hypothetical protein
LSLPKLFINHNDLAGGDHFSAVFLEGGDEAVDDVAFEVVVLLAVGRDAVGDGKNAAGNNAEDLFTIVSDL